MPDPEYGPPLPDDLETVGGLPPHRLRAADPDQRDQNDTMAAGKVFLVMVGVLALAALFNAETMLHRAETSELGFRRDLALAFWGPIEAASAPLGFGLPRSGVEALRGSGDNGGGSVTAGAPTGPNGGDHSGQLGHEPAGPSIDLSPLPPLAGPLDPQATAPPDPGTTSTETPLGLPTPAPPEPTTGDPGSDPASDPGSDPGSDPAGDPAGDPATSAAAPETSTEAATTAAIPTTGVPPTTNSQWLRQPTAEDPLRVLIVGDSTMDAVGNSMLRDLANTGVVAAQLEFRISTGLSRPDFFDWPAHLREVRAANGTEIVVIMIGANDAQPFLIAETPENYGTELWFDTYRQRVAGLLDELTADGSWVVWIGQPIMRNNEFDQKMQTLNQIYAEELSRYPTAVYIDARSIMTDETGAYSAYLLDGAGNRVLVRQSDGVHLTTAGGDRLSPVIVDGLNQIAPLR